MKSIKILITMFVFVLLNNFVYASGFVDLDKSHWAYNSINEMVNKGIINGYTDNTFRPDDALTRAEFITLLVKHFGKDKEIIQEETLYNDVNKDDWFYEYVQNGGKYMRIRNNYFYPNESIKREDVAYALAKITELNTYVPNLTVLDRFKDKDDISIGYFKDYIALVVSYGYMSGKGDYFDPQAPLTRAEVSALLNEIKDISPVKPQIYVSNAEGINIKKNSTYTLTISVDGYVGKEVELFYNIKEPGIINCEWGGWDGFTIPLYITGISEGVNSLTINTHDNQCFFFTLVQVMDDKNANNIEINKGYEEKEKIDIELEDDDSIDSTSIRLEIINRQELIRKMQSEIDNIEDDVRMIEREVRNVESDLRRAESNLAKAKTQKISVYREGLGFVYEVDEEAVRDAEDYVETYKGILDEYEIMLDGFDDMIDDYERNIEKLEEEIDELKSYISY